MRLTSSINCRGRSTNTLSIRIASRACCTCFEVGLMLSGAGKWWDEYECWRTIIVTAPFIFAYNSNIWFVTSLRSSFFVCLSVWIQENCSGTLLSSACIAAVRRSFRDTQIGWNLFGIMFSVLVQARQMIDEIWLLRISEKMSSESSDYEKSKCSVRATDRIRAFLENGAQIYLPTAHRFWTYVPMWSVLSTCHFKHVWKESFKNFFT